MQKSLVNDQNTASWKLIYHFNFVECDGYLETDDRF